MVSNDIGLTSGEDWEPLACKANHNQMIGKNICGLKKGVPCKVCHIAALIGDHSKRREFVKDMSFSFNLLCSAQHLTTLHFTASKEVEVGGLFFRL